MFLTGIIYPAPLILGYFDLTLQRDLSIGNVFMDIYSCWYYNNIIGNMIRDSMVADIADEVELITDKRQEGVLLQHLVFTKG